VDGGTNAYGGEITIATGPTEPEMATIALAVLELSARLVAVSVTGFDEGTEAGAR
jgi:hypothetical protein